LSSDGEHFKASDGQLVDNVNTRDSLTVHEGKYSVKLTKEKSFGMTFRNKNIKTGDILQVSVWRYSANKHNGTLVISCDKNFYQASSDIIEEDSKGWDKIILFATIPAEHDNLGIYLWNNEEESVWFDDLQVVKYK
jgi:hypothetical protein